MAVDVARHGDGPDWKWSVGRVWEGRRRARPDARKNRADAPGLFWHPITRAKGQLIATETVG